MSRPAERIVVVAVKRTVIAFEKETGARLWSQNLGSGLTGDFVTVAADATRVYAHTHGEMFSLDLFTGAVLWRDGLSGLGYGIASIALPGMAASSGAALVARLRQDQTDSAAGAPGPG